MTRKEAPAASHPPDERERVWALRDLGLLDSAPERRYDDLATLAARLCDAPVALISLVDETRVWFKARVGLEITETPRDGSFCAHVILGSEVFVVPDAHADPRFVNNALVTGSHGACFYAGAPLRMPSGHNVGALSVLDARPRQLTSDQRAQLEMLARLVVDQIARTQDVVELRRALALAETESDRRLRALFDAAPIAAAFTDLEGRFERVNPAYSRMVGYSEEELLGRRFADLAHPDDRAGEAPLVRAPSTGARSGTFTRMATRSGG